MIRRRKRIWAVLLSAAMMAAQLPAAAMAETQVPHVPEDGEIASFAALPKEVKMQTVPVGSQLTELNLPEELSVKVYHVTEEIVTPDTEEENDTPAATPDDASEDTGENGGEQKMVTRVTTVEELIPVTWDSKTPYDGDTPADYVFTADVGNYVLASGVKPPQITVTVKVEEENQPCTLMDGCTLPDGHEGDCVLPPSKLAKANTYAANNTVTKGGITIAASDGGEVVYIDGSGFSLNQTGTYEISGTWDGTETVRNAVITVPDGVTVDITLRGVTIDVSLKSGCCAFAVEPGGTADVTVSGTNSLKSGWDCAGLEVSEDAELTLTSADNGRLEVQGGRNSAGIGGSDRNGGCIIISGNIHVTASGGENGAGIGGGAAGDGGIIEIRGGTVTANGGYGSAGIGGGTREDRAGSYVAGGAGVGASVTISGPDTKVTAAGGDKGLDVGGGYGRAAYADGGSLSVTDGAVLEMKKSGTNVTDPEYKSCTIVDKNGNRVQYDENGVTPLVEWDGQSDMSASGLSVGAGGTIRITGSNTSGGAILTIDVNNVTVTSDGVAVSGVCIEMENNTNINSLTIENLNLTAQKGKRAIHIIYSAASTLTVKGTCKITGGSFDNYNNDGQSAVSKSGGPLTVEVGDADLTAIGGEPFTGFTGGGGVAGSQLTVNINSGSMVSRGVEGSAGLSGTVIVIDNKNGNVLLEGLKGTKYRGKGLLGDSITLSGSGTTVVEGEIGIWVNNKLTVDGEVTVTGVSERIYGSGGGTINGAGSLTVDISGSGSSYPGNGISYEGDLNLDFAGHLTVYGGPGTEGHGIAVDGDLTVSRAPASMDIRPGSNTDGHALHVTGDIKNLSGIIPDSVLVKNDAAPVLWPYYAVAYASTEHDGGTVPDTAYYPKEKVVTVEGNTGSLTRDGYQFAGWSWGGTTYVEGNTFPMPEEDVTLTAQWTKDAPPASNRNSGGESAAVTTPKDSYKTAGDSISQAISRSELNRLAESSKGLTFASDMAEMRFSAAGIRAILAAVPATAGSITFTAARADLSAHADAAALIGTRPVYDFTIGYKDGVGNNIQTKVDFPAGSVSITLNYTPTANETSGSLFMVYVDDNGCATWLNKSSYIGGRILADIAHFSTYGVAYKAPAPVFVDTAEHWAKDEIEFVAARGLLDGTGNSQFSPDTAMTRGMIVTALGRLAGIAPEDYPTRSFTDVKADVSYAAYAEWAAQKNILTGTGENLFSPDELVTREQMAVILMNYASQMGIPIPAPLAETTFTDSGSISSWAAIQVTAMQRAGVMKGRAAGRFEPQAAATRAEVSAMLRRFVEVVIDSSTASGWSRNDDGQWFYYNAGRFFTGWREIDGKWYYFHPDGSMAVSTTIDGYVIDSDGRRKEAV